MTQRDPLELLVLADDRTGALETAGLSADAGLASIVVPLAWDGDLPPHRCRVVDLAGRVTTPAEAARRAASVVLPARRHAHKIDSTLKGNWARELIARAMPTMVVPAFPAAGRICVDGVVLVDGEPIGRPADRLRGTDVTICDAETDADLDRHAMRWMADPAMLLAGTAGAIGAGARAITGGASPTPPPQVSGPVLVVCGSRQTIAHDQAAALGDAFDVILVGDDFAEVDVARDRLADVAAVLIVGGDTAAAVLGERPMVVGGTVATGVPWCRFADGDGPLVLTKPGGFGDERTLLRVLQAILLP